MIYIDCVDQLNSCEYGNTHYTTELKRCVSVTRERTDANTRFSLLSFVVVKLSVFSHRTTSSTTESRIMHIAFFLCISPEETQSAQ